MRYPVLVPCLTQIYQCDTPFCKISRDTCGIPPPPPENKHENILRYYCLECRKWGLRDGGFKQIAGYLRKKAFFLRFLDFQVLFGPSGKGQKRQKKGEKGRPSPGLGWGIAPGSIGSILASSWACWGKPTPGVWLAPVGRGLPRA